MPLTTETTPHVLAGRPFALGAHPEAGGVRFAVASSVAEGVEVCLVDQDGSEQRVELTQRTFGVWHGLVAGVTPGQRYGYRVHGPYDPSRGLRCNPAKLLLDPYAQATTGDVRFGPEVLDYDVDHDHQPSRVDSAPAMPRSLGVDVAFDWSGTAKP